MADNRPDINNWWGKILGGGVGVLVAGPWGLVLGLVVGHGFDLHQSGLIRFRRQGSDPERFPDTVFQVMGCLAKADGRVSEAEIAAAREAIQQLGLDEKTAERVKRCFSEGKQRGFPLEAALRRARRICGPRTDRGRVFLELLVRVALADGAPRPAERRILEQACHRLGFGRADLEQLISLLSGHGSDAGRHGRPRQAAFTGDVNRAYSILGVARGSSDEAIKKAYRRLMSQHHPDKLAARGLSPEMMKLSEEKTVEIRAAYDRVREARGMR